VYLTCGQSDVIRLNSTQSITWYHSLYFLATLHQDDSCISWISKIGGPELFCVHMVCSYMHYTPLWGDKALPSN